MAATENATTDPNARWPREATELYLRQPDRIEAMNGPFGEAMFDAAELQPGERVLDVGCGFGTTTLDAARRVSPGGAAVGIDITAALLVEARRRAMAAGLGDVEFLEADAEAHAFEEAAYDAVISRFGVMFFSSPEVAFRNLHRALRPGGRLVVVCPGHPRQSEWVAVAFGAAAPHVGLPELGPAGGPGPFAFADGSRLTRAIEGGGFRDVTLQAIDRTVRMGNDVGDVADFITSLPESRQLFRGQAEAKITAAVDALREGFAPYARPGGVLVRGSAWLASARR